MNLLNFFRKRIKSKSRVIASFISWDNDSIVFETPKGEEIKIAWAALDAISIETTDQGPFLEDMFWIFIQGEQTIVLPNDVHGTDALLKMVQNLPNFDNELLVKATTNTDNARFDCWKRN